MTRCIDFAWILVRWLEKIACMRLAHHVAHHVVVTNIMQQQCSFRTVICFLFFTFIRNKFSDYEKNQEYQLPWR